MELSRAILQGTVSQIELVKSRMCGTHTLHNEYRVHFIGKSPIRAYQYKNI